MSCLILCKECGKEYESRYSTTKFCSDKCRRKYNGKHKGHKRVCKQCNKVFYNYKERIYCSMNCRRKFEKTKKEKELEKQEFEHKQKGIIKLVNTLSNIIFITRKCVYCGKEFILKKYETGHKYCSEECKKEGYKICRRSKKKYRIDKDKRLSKNGKIDYSISIEQLYKRDKGICYLCGKKTDFNDYKITKEGHFIAGNNYPSIDHVKPIAKGGLHEWDNVKLAHRLCNSIKQDNEFKK